MGHILLTTRAQAVGALAQHLAVEEMDQQEGMLLLLRRARRLVDGTSYKTVSASEQRVAQAIAHDLGGLPLALDQAGAYLEETSCSLDDYHQLYQTRRKDLLGLRKTLSAEHPEPVSTTWSLSFGHVEQANPAAAALLRFCAYLAPDAIPEELLVEAAPELGDILEPVVADLLHLNAAIEVLRRYSLLKRQAETKSLSIHRLVQAVLQDAMSSTEQRAWAERAVRAINRVFPQVKLETWAQCLRYLPHAQVCADLIEHYDLSSEAAARLLHRTGLYLHAHARYAEAEHFYRQALAVYSNIWPTDHPSIADMLHDLGRLYWYLGKYEQAERLYQQALAIYHKTLPIDNPQSAATLHQLAVLYHDQGKYEQAEALYQQALTMEQKTLPADHPDTYTTIQSYANLLRRTKREQEAAALEARMKTK
jgi:tetratricopeptide (TPR) repeat protein